MYTLMDLLPTLHHLQTSEYEGITGVLCMDSGVPGPTLGVTICTHGNEPAGLAPFHYALHDESFRSKLKNGRILFVLNNAVAAQKAFSATDFEERGKHRIEDINMNRLPADIRDRAPSEEDPYEVRRVRELLPVYKEFTAAIDFHSTSFPCETMLITMGADTALFTDLPVALEIANIVPHSVGVPAMYYYGTGDIPRAVLECGYHEDQKTFDFAVRAFEELLGRLGMRDVALAPSQSRRSYRVFQGVMFPDETYELTRVFEPFEMIPAHTVYARGQGPDLITQRDSVVLFPFAYKKPPSVKEEVMFFAEDISVTP